MNITFHVVIPKVFWEWDLESRVYIRFGHPKLGEWSDCGEFQERRYVYCIICHNVLQFCIFRDFRDGMFEMICTFPNFDVEILKHPLPYKYVIHSPKAKKDEECYEYLHVHSSTWKEFNRCLVIPPEHRKAPGIQ